MAEEQRLREWVKSHDGEDYCAYCLYEEDCPGGVVCYGGMPVEPPCILGKDILDILNTETILEDIEAEAADA